MDQTGALEPGTVERLVLWAKDSRLRGSIDVRGARAATLYFSAGFIAHIDDGAGAALAPADDKARVHARLAGRLSDLLAVEDGSYVVNHSTELPPDARWLFGPQGLLDSARESGSAAGTLTRWAGVVVDLDSTSVDGPRLFSEDAVRVLVAMARTLDALDLQTELRWPGARIEDVLDELRRSKLLAPGTQPSRPVVPPPTVLPRPADPAPSAPPLDLRTRDAAPAAVTGSGYDDRIAHQAAAVKVDAPDQPDPPADGRTRASALRRLIQNLR